MPCIPFTTGTLRPRCQTSISSPSSVLYWTAQCASTKGRSRIRTDMTVPGPTVKIVAGCGMRSRRVVGLGHEEITPNAKKDIRNARYFVIVDPGLGNYFAPGRDWQPCNACAQRRRLHSSRENDRRNVVLPLGQLNWEFSQGAVWGEWKHPRARNASTRVSTQGSPGIFSFVSEPAW